MKILKKFQKKKKSVERNKRVKIQHFHEIYILIDKDKFQVESVSIGGLAFKAPGNPLQLKKNDTINAVVKVVDSVCDIKINIRYIGKDLIGCQVDSSCEIFRVYVKDYFKSELDGLKLRKISADKLKENKNGTPHWLYGESDLEIFFTDEEGEITTFQINFHGQMVVYERGVVYTGYVWEDEREDIAYKSADLIKPADALSKESMEYIFRFIEVIPDLEKEFKDQILHLVDAKFKKDWDQKNTMD